MSTFLINKKNYFFQVDCDVDVSKFECEVFDTIDEMYSRVCEKLNLQRDEIEGNEIFIDELGHEHSFNGCSIDTKPELSIEQYIDQWEC
jgi:hypothetical protein